MKVLDFLVVFLAGAFIGLITLTGFVYFSEMALISLFNVFYLTSAGLLTTLIYIKGKFQIRKLKKAQVPKELEEAKSEKTIIVYDD